MPQTAMQAASPTNIARELAEDNRQGFHLVSALEGVLIAMLQEQGVSGEVTHRGAQKVEFPNVFPRDAQDVSCHINIVRKTEGHSGWVFATADAIMFCGEIAVCVVSGLYVAIGEEDPPETESGGE